jgi:flagellar basal-body rod protein FlgF
LVRGLYTAASGALVAEAQANNVANNLANASSGGFKQTLLQIQSATPMDIYRIQTDPGRIPGKALAGVPAAPYVGSLGTGAQIYDTPEDFAQGPLQETGNKLDVALTGANGFFSVETPQGLRYTRDGQFTLDANGNLLTMDGNAVIGQNNQPIQVQQQLGPVTIGSDGTISQNGQIINKLTITSFANLVNLRKEGDNNFVDTGNAQAGTSTSGVQQGFLEQSNGNIVSSMVNLITAERWFDANERVIKTEDDATNTAINSVGKSNPA